MPISPNLNVNEKDKFTEDGSGATCVRICGEAIPQGLANQGMIDLFEVTNTEWRRLSLAALITTMRAINIQNTDGSGNENPSAILLNYALPVSPAVAPVATYGTLIRAGGERFYDKNDNVDFWLRSISGTFNVTVERIA